MMIIIVPAAQDEYDDYHDEDDDLKDDVDDDYTDQDKEDDDLINAVEICANLNAGGKIEFWT